MWEAWVQSLPPPLEHTPPFSPEETTRQLQATGLCLPFLKGLGQVTRHCQPEKVNRHSLRGQGYPTLGIGQKEPIVWQGVDRIAHQ